MTKLYCSVFGLSGATIASLVGIALVGISFSTDNWQHISVNRGYLSEFSVSNRTELKERLNIDLRYFDRVRGIFRVCFPYDTKPKIDGKLYLNPVEEWCTNVDYRFKLWGGGLLPPRITRNAALWFHFARSVIAAFILYFMFTGVACVTGLMGCWSASGDHLISTAVLMLLASLSAIAGMGFWHAAEFYEIGKVLDEKLEFYPSWPEHLQKATTFSTGWSYIVSWIGISFTLLSSLLFSGSAICIRDEFKLIESQNLATKMRFDLGYAATLQAEGGRRGYFTGPPPVINYYSAGFPAQSYEDICEGTTRNGLYKSVVRELEDAKL